VKVLPEVYHVPRRKRLRKKKGCSSTGQVRKPSGSLKSKRREGRNLLISSERREVITDRKGRGRKEKSSECHKGKGKTNSTAASVNGYWTYYREEGRRRIPL